MKDDVAGLVERLEAFRPTYGWPEEQAITSGPPLGQEAASTIRAQSAKLREAELQCDYERERKEQNAEDCRRIIAERQAAYAKLREAVEVMHRIEHEAIIRQPATAVQTVADLRAIARAFLATMEKPHD